jgi:hypothetical protein
MKSLAQALSAAALTFAISAPVSADEFTPALQELAESQIKAMVNDPAIVAAIQAQNEKHAGMSEADIVALDDKWRAEIGTGSTPTIDPVLNGAVADMLRGLRDESGGMFTEIFVMDSVGLNVASSDTTSDFWQGDEAKWQQTYGAGSGSVHISDVELDESTQTYQAQVSVSIDGADGTPIGAATFGVNVEYLN